jgi:hypothetical protein
LAYGKTARFERTQIWDVAPLHADHLDSGWITRETWARYLKQLPEDAKREPINLLLDADPIHVLEVARELAEDLQIKLHFNPCSAGSSGA